MKNIKLIPILTISAFLLTFMSCQDDESRFPDFVKAANVRIQLNPDYSSLNAEDIPNAKLEFSLFSENKNIQSVVLSGVYYNFAMDSTFDKVELMSWAQADFDTNGGAIRNVDFTSQFLADKFGLPNGIDDMGGGDRFDISNVTTLTNGMIFPDSVLQGMPQKTINVTPNIVNSAATTSFSVGFTAYVACPVPAGFATGDYTLEQTDGPEDGLVVGSGPRWITQKVSLTAVSPIQREFSGTYLSAFDGRKFDVLLVCGNVLVPTTSSGLSCGGPDLSWTGETPPGTYNQEADSVITIIVKENVYGACGEDPGLPMTLKLTKIK